MDMYSGTRRRHANFCGKKLRFLRVSAMKRPDRSSGLASSHCRFSVSLGRYSSGGLYDSLWSTSQSFLGSTWEGEFRRGQVGRGVSTLLSLLLPHVVEQLGLVGRFYTSGGGTHSVRSL